MTTGECGPNPWCHPWLLPPAQALYGCHLRNAFYTKYSVPCCCQAGSAYCLFYLDGSNGLLTLLPAAPLLPTPSCSQSQHGSHSQHFTAVSYIVLPSCSALPLLPCHPPWLPFALRRAMSSPWPPRPSIRTWQMFSVKDQTVKILDFTGHTWSLSYSLFYFN